MSMNPFSFALLVSLLAGLAGSQKALANVCGRDANDVRFIKVIPLGNDRVRFESCKVGTNDCARIGAGDSYSISQVKHAEARLNNASRFGTGWAIAGAAVLITTAFVTQSDPTILYGFLGMDEKAGFSWDAVSGKGLAVPLEIASQGAESLKLVRYSLNRPMHECTYSDLPIETEIRRLGDALALIDQKQIALAGERDSYLSWTDMRSKYRSAACR